MPLTGPDQLAELRLAGAREGLARHASGDELDVVDAPTVKLLEQLARIGQIADVAEPAEIGRVGLDRPRISIRADENREPGVAQTKREPACAAEQIDDARARSGGNPPTDGSEIPWIWASGFGARCKCAARGWHSGSS